MRCEWGGTTHTVAFTAGLKRPPPSPRSGHTDPVPTGGGKEGEAGLRDSGQLCHLVAGVRSEGGGGGALYSVPQVAVTAGVSGGGTPSPCPRPRACGLGGGGQRALPAIASAAPRAALHGSPSAPGKGSGGNFFRSPRGLSGVGREEKDRAGIAPHEATSSGHLRAVLGRGVCAPFIDRSR